MLRCDLHPGQFLLDFLIREDLGIEGSDRLQPANVSPWHIAEDIKPLRYNRILAKSPPRLLSVQRIDGIKLIPSCVEVMVCGRGFIFLGSATIKGCAGFCQQSLTFR